MVDAEIQAFASKKKPYFISTGTETNEEVKEQTKTEVPKIVTKDAVCQTEIEEVKHVSFSIGASLVDEKPSRDKQMTSRSSKKKAKKSKTTKRPKHVVFAAQTEDNETQKDADKENTKPAF